MYTIEYQRVIPFIQLRGIKTNILSVSLIHQKGGGRERRSPLTQSKPRNDCRR